MSRKKTKSMTRNNVCYAIEGHVVDRNTANNGKGWCEDVSPTLNTQDRHAVVYAIEGNGARPSHMGRGYSCDGTMYTLNTIEQHSVCYGISRSALKGGNASTGGMPIEEDVMPTITANGTGAICYAIENHAHDCRVTMDDSGIVQTLSSRMGTGGNNTPFVLIRKEPECYAIDSHPLDSRISIAGDICPTITYKIAKAASDGPLALIRRSE